MNKRAVTISAIGIFALLSFIAIILLSTNHNENKNRLPSINIETKKHSQILIAGNLYITDIEEKHLPYHIQAIKECPEFGLFIQKINRDTQINCKLHDKVKYALVKEVDIADSNNFKHSSGDLSKY
jgi:hypothetical protein